MSRAKSNRGRGRPARSTSFYLVPVRHATPNPRKFGRAFLAAAVHRGEPQGEVESTEGGARDGTP